jgi:hypothetical protein
MKYATLILGLALVAIAVSSAAIAQRADQSKPPPINGDCYWIFRPQSEGFLRSILLNRCTGETWVLQLVRTSDGKYDIARWFPLGTEKNEFVIPAQPSR